MPLRYRIVINGLHRLDARYIADFEDNLRHCRSLGLRCEVHDTKTGKTWLNPTAKQVLKDVGVTESTNA